MRAEPWEVGALPTDCPKCGAVHWIKAPFERLECCGEPFRTGGGDSKPHAWYVALCESVRAGYRAHVLALLDAKPQERCEHPSRTRFVGCGGRAFWICDACERVVERAESEP